MELTLGRLKHLIKEELENLVPFDSLVGRTVGLCGVDNNVVCLKVGSRKLAFEAREDESDGYRSMMDEVVPVPVAGHIFFKTPVAQVRVERVVLADFDGYDLVDETGHTWLRLGTSTTDEYYPMFIFDYAPAGAKVTSEGYDRPMEAQESPFIVYVSDTNPEVPVGARLSHVKRFNDLKSAQAYFISLAARTWKPTQWVMAAKRVPPGVFNTIASSRGE